MSTSDHVSEKNTLEQDNHSDKENGPPESNNVSMGDVITGTAVQELTPFERKAALINASVITMMPYDRVRNMLTKSERLTSSASENTKNVFGSSVDLAILSTWPGRRVLGCWLLQFCRLDCISEKHYHSHPLAVKRWVFQLDSKVSYSLVPMLV